MPVFQKHRPVLTSRAVWAAALIVGFANIVHGQSAAPDTVARDAHLDAAGRRRILVLPALGSTPETGLQYGVSALAVWERARLSHTRPSTLTASAIRTAKSQTRLRMDAEHWSGGNARRSRRGTLQWQEFPLPYFGIGDDTPSSNEETFVPRGTEASVTVQQRVAGAWYGTAGVRHVDQRISSDSTRGAAHIRHHRQQRRDGSPSSPAV
ncbi:MAG: hypothetical protein U5K74_11950 [Gemmatimonadaceae bacterium]|nr:hypothetical protein [Gemmatimonadaceae bacterium]